MTEATLFREHIWRKWMGTYVLDFEEIDQTQVAIVGG